MPTFDRTFLFERLPRLADLVGGGSSHKRSWCSTAPPPIHLDDQVAWADEQLPLRRTKRPALRHGTGQQPRTSRANDDQEEEDYDVTLSLLAAANRRTEDQWFSDELWPAQWYLRDGAHQMNLNVLAVYERGWTGRGVRVAVLDDGLEHWHDDLAQNYVRILYIIFYMYGFICTYPKSLNCHPSDCLFCRLSYKHLLPKC